MHDGGDGAADGPRLRGIVGDAAPHQHRPHVGVAEAERAEVPALLGDHRAGIGGHEHADLEHHRPQPAGVAEALDIEAAVRPQELDEIDGGEVARGVVEEHVLRARIARVDAAVLGAGVPLVDGGVVLHPRVRAGPGRVGDLVPDLGGGNGLGDPAVGAAPELPVPTLVEHVEEAAGDADRVVGVLAGDGEVGLAVPIGVVLGEDDLGHSGGGQMQGLLDVRLGHEGRARLAHGRPQSRVLLRIRLDAVAGAGRLQHRLQPPLAEARARHQRGHLLLFHHLPADELHHVGMVEVEADHLGRPARRPARLDRPRRPVADLEEGHEPGGLAAAREGLVFTPERREVRPGARTILEDAGLASPQVHDAAVIDQIVGHGLDEAGVGLRPLIGAAGAGQGSRVGVDEVVALGRPGEAVGVVEARVKPLRRIGRRDLCGQHVGELVVERARVRRGIEVAVALAPVGPAARHPMKDLPGVPLAPEHRLSVLVQDRPVVGADLRHPRFAEIFLGQDVHRDRRPFGGRGDTFLAEDRGSIRIPYLRVPLGEFDAGVGTLAFRGETTGDSHAGLLFWTLLLLDATSCGFRLTDTVLPTQPGDAITAENRPPFAFRLQEVSQRPTEREAQHIVAGQAKSTFIW